MRVLITGVNGFVGPHLVEFLQAERPDVEIVGLIKPGSPPVRPGVQALEADLDVASSVEAALGDVTADAVVHLAAQSSPQLSWSDPAGTLRTNLHGLLHLLEVVRRRAPIPRVVVVGSVEEYGAAAASELPLGEDAPLRPASPYAVSKVAQGFLALQYWLSHGVPTVRTRAFHHSGPGRAESFAESSFARQIAEIEAGLREPVVRVGNLDVVRDFTDVRDVVRAYWLLLERGEPGEVYNVCRGTGVRMGELLDELVAASGRRLDVRVDPERLRPSDVPVLVGDPGKLRRRTSWEPRIGLGRTMRDLLDDWRQKVSFKAEGAGARRGT
ncbi:MAG: GDP-mannose 4,6-dehydratase [Acidobacteria bacterium]|nr:MAG: GDP-mannose 4,6-dehydratase [Acidobacteriota bacterium]PYQ22714.1 MAG: GDP-mannose 4,6-dehydratase [Acidobacteriota bacterium]